MLKRRYDSLVANVASLSFRQAFVVYALQRLINASQVCLLLIFVLGERGHQDSLSRLPLSIHQEVEIKTEYFVYTTSHQFNTAENQHFAYCKVLVFS